MKDFRDRSAGEVFEDHLRRQGKHGSVEDDFDRNYAEDVVLTGHSVYRGCEGLAHLAQIRREERDGADG